jgi:AraC-like DNA-binding protein
MLWFRSMPAAASKRRARKRSGGMLDELAQHRTRHAGQSTLPHQIRATVLTNYAEVARFTGLDPTRLIREVGLDSSLLDAPEQMIAAAPVMRLLELSADRSNCCQFGLLMAESRSFASLGAISLLLKHRGSVREIIETLIRYQPMFGDAITIVLEDLGDSAVFRADYAAGFQSIQATELHMGIAHQTLTAAVSGRWSPRRAHFRHAAPAELGVHRRIFQCPLVFESDYDGFECETEALDTSNPGARTAMARYAQQYLDTIAPDPAGAPVTARVRRAIYLLLPVGRATLEQVGRSLGVHPRALQRRLAEEMRTFEAIVVDVRRELVLRYLPRPTLPIGAIARLAGYSSPSAFSRWFCNEFGASPAAWRAEIQSVARG